MASHKGFGRLILSGNPMSTQPKKLTALWVALPVGYLIIVVLAAGGGGLGMVASPWIWTVTAMVLTACIGITLFIPGHSQRWWCIAGIWGMVLGAILGAYGTEWFKLRFGEKVTIKASEAHRHPDAHIYDLEDGRPAMHLGIAEYSSTGSEGKGIYYTAVVPVVDEDWDKSQPVSMWAVCHEVLTSGTYARKQAWIERRDSGCGGDWKHPDWHLALHADTSLGDEDIQAAIELHTKSYKLRSAKGAVAVRWIDSVDAIIEKSGSVTYGWLIASLLGWPIVMCLVRLAEFLSRRKAGATKAQQTPTGPVGPTV